MNNLSKFGVQELNAKEVVIIEGGKNKPGKGFWGEVLGGLYELVKLNKGLPYTPLLA